MKYSLLATLREHCLELDEQVQRAVEAACEPGALQAMLNEVAAKEIRSAVSQEIERFYRYGKGREVIKDIVAAKLDREFQENKDYHRFMGEQYAMEGMGRTESGEGDRRVLRDGEIRSRRTRPSAGSDRGNLRRPGRHRSSR
jgi:hypothetical protein